MHKNDLIEKIMNGDYPTDLKVAIQWNRVDTSNGEDECIKSFLRNEIKIFGIKGETNEYQIKCFIEDNCLKIIGILNDKEYELFNINNLSSFK